MRLTWLVAGLGLEVPRSSRVFSLSTLLSLGLGLSLVGHPGHISVGCPSLVGAWCGIFLVHHCETLVAFLEVTPTEGWGSFKIVAPISLVLTQS